MARIQLEQEKCLAQTQSQVGLCFVHLGNCFSQVLTSVQRFCPQPWARLAVKPLQVSCQQLFQEHQALGAALPMGMSLGRQENKALKKHSWLCHLGASFLHQHNFTWVADRDSEEQFSLLSLSKVMELSLSWWIRWFWEQSVLTWLFPGSNMGSRWCKKKNAPVQSKPSRGETLI